jgi:N-acetylmuramoyl-L-alanine amidase
MKIIDRPSPNFDSRCEQPIDMLVLHYTGMFTAQGALDKLCNSDCVRKVSAHYVVDEDGTIYQLVDETNRAWHAGLSSWRGNSNINQRSIGIEIVNPGHEYGYRPFPSAQMESVADLCAAIISRHAIPARNVVGHSDIAPERKDDPGELFSWPWLASQGVGLFPLLRAQRSNPDWIATSPAAPRDDELARYGYSTANMQKTILAFQRHFRPNLLTGLWDNECAALLAALNKIV